MAFDLSTINQKLSPAVQEMGDAIQSAMPTNGEEMTNAEMIDLQFKLSQWQMASSMQSNIMKSMSDGVKSTIQNLR